MTKLPKTPCGVGVLACLLAADALAQTTPAPALPGLYREFQNPGNAARPRVWWHWMSGNIAPAGIRKDLLWMQRSGIGGFQTFDASLPTPLIVPKRVEYMSPDWKAAFRLATRLADSLQLEMAIAGSPGWSESGGPWVPPQDGMKKLVWREVRVPGGRPFRGALPRPSAVEGAFQNLGIIKGATGAFETETPPTPEYYADVAVVAYRLPAADVAPAALRPTITASGGTFTLAQLTDGDLGTTSLLPADPAKGTAWIQYAYPKPQTIKGVTVVGGDIRPWAGIVPPAEDRTLEASDDGQTFRLVAAIPAGGVGQQTITIPATTARYFRVTFKNPAAPVNIGAILGTGGEAPPAPAGTGIAELVLHPVTRINHFEEKAGFAATYDIAAYPTPASGDVVAPADIVDLTAKLTADGQLSWTPPAGEWKIVRFGYSLTGHKNTPANPEATGLEVDKLDADAVKRYFTTYLDQYKDATGGLMGRQGLRYVITDSWEAGQGNWTPQMAAEFRQRRGYSLVPWLPVLTGQVVKSTEASEQFLWDWRQTIGELIAEKHYDQLTTLLAARGMARYSESHENGRALLADGMDVKRTAAVPMGAMWLPGVASPPAKMAQADIRESASVAHLYGQNLVAAESLTALGLAGRAWSYAPEDLKPTADLELASGLNRFVIHTSVHQPVDDKIPGLSLFVVGQWFNRHETWAEQAKPWMDYLARSSYLLQQGRAVADVAYYYGEGSNITSLFGEQLPAVPAGYEYDFVNPHALLHLLSVQDGQLVTPSGMRYRVLALDDNARQMSLPVLRKIAQLAQAGATICGVQPEKSPSLADDPQEFQRLVQAVWGAGNPRVSTGRPLADVLSGLQATPDFTYAPAKGGAEVLYVHRQTPEADIYWVNSRSNEAAQVEASFRVAGKVPQLWHPDTGLTEPAAYRTVAGRTVLTLRLVPHEAVFVVFAAPAAQPVLALPARTEQELATVDGPWQVAFQPRRGVPTSASFAQLASFSENSEAGIKYFSGTATYSKTIRVPATARANNAQVWLDLGDVKNLAEVIVNGKSLGIVWKKPFRVDVTNALKTGDNAVQVKVTNLWVNRLIGDAQPGAAPKITYTTVPFFKPTARLKPSGLLGPVKLISTTN
ncbi:glycosyl hydrolase [Hymenobacter monticola]|uniref:Glycoside hydrolase n=1 Tax=Hymenobacter monticola TaxID=1705399 RepID=A0ABY4BF88_9BACT|nr:glycosyl hydrolase [Hymenobacter monticola]UOE36406.1 glycoside hydrolase [Hymenobacter monticola]